MNENWPIDVSHKMRVLSFAAFLGVMFIHSSVPLYTPGCAWWNLAFASFLCKHLVCWAVPFFFFASGFWFGKGQYLRGEESYGSLLRRKSKTLLIPYLLWSIIGAIIGVPLILINNHIQHQPMLSRTFLDGTGVLDCVGKLLGLTCFLPMHCGVLWFVKLLLLVFVIAFVWRVFVRNVLMVCVLFILASIAVLSPSLKIPYLGLGTNTLGFFSLGVVAAQMNWLSQRVSRWLFIVSTILWISISILMGGTDASGIPAPEWLLRLLPILGIVGMIGLYDNCKWLNSLMLRPWALETFWLYCSHQIIASWVIAILLFVFGKGDLVAFVLMFVTPILVIPISLSLSALVKRFCRPLHNRLTGERTK